MGPADRARHPHPTSPPASVCVPDWTFSWASATQSQRRLRPGLDPRGPPAPSGRQCWPSPRPCGRSSPRPGSSVPPILLTITVLATYECVHVCAYGECVCVRVRVHACGFVVSVNHCISHEMTRPQGEDSGVVDLPLTPTYLMRCREWMCSQTDRYKLVEKIVMTE